MKEVLIAALAMLALAGCSATERGATVGGASGAAIGAAVNDDAVEGAVVGGVVGAAAGALIGRASERTRMVSRWSLSTSSVSRLCTKPMT